MYRSRIYVDKEGLERVRALSATHTVVFVPTHKSHLDYMTLCYILFVYGLTCPHIAAGAGPGPVCVLCSIGACSQHMHAAAAWARSGLHVR